MDHTSPSEGAESFEDLVASYISVRNVFKNQLSRHRSERMMATKLFGRMSAYPGATLLGKRITSTELIIVICNASIHRTILLKTVLYNLPVIENKNAKERDGKDQEMAEAVGALRAGIMRAFQITRAELYGKIVALTELFDKEEAKLWLNTLEIDDDMVRAVNDARMVYGKND